jgi:hypothetical protein
LIKLRQGGYRAHQVKECDNPGGAEKDQQYVQKNHGRDKPIFLANLASLRENSGSKNTFCAKT